MKKLLALSCACLLGFASNGLQASSLPIPIVFNNISGIDNNLVWVQFMGGTNVSGGEFRDINGHTQTIAANTAYSLSSLISGTTPLVPGQDGKPILQLDEVISGRVYISFGLEGLQGMGSPGGPYTPAANSMADPNYLIRYQYFELTVQNGNLTADLSYIDFTAISFSMLGKEAPNGSNLSQLSHPGSTLVNAVVPTALKNGENVIPGAAFVLPSPEFARVIGPGYEIVVPGEQTAQAVYRDFSEYLGNLADTTTTVTLAGLFAGTGKSDNPTTQQQMYNFTATFNSDHVEMKAVTTAGIASGDGGEGNQSSSFPVPEVNRGQGVGSNNSIIVTYAELNKATGVYGANPTYTVTNNGVTTVSYGLTNDFYGWVMGDLLAGLSLGFIGSTQAVSPGPEIKDLASSGWWGGGVPTATEPGINQYVPDTTNNSWQVVNNKTTPAANKLTYSAAQPNNPTFYNIYSNALTGPIAPVTDGYSFPFGDRLGQNLLSFDVGTDSGAYLQFDINTDSGTTIPVFQWDSGNNTGNWGDAANWNPNGVPNDVPTSVPVVEFGTGSQTTIDLQADRTVNGVFFNAGSASFTLSSGHNLILADTPSATSPFTGFIANFSNNLQTIEATLELQTAATIASVDGDFTFGDIQTGTHSMTFSSAGATGHTTTVGGTITGSGRIFKIGLGTLALSGNNLATYSGTVELLGGTLQLANSNSLGSGALELAGGTLQSGASPLILANVVSLGSSASVGAASTVGFQGTEPITFNGGVTVNGSTTLNLGTNVTFDGIVGPAGSTAAAFTLTQTGTGTLTLGGASPNTFGGSFVVKEGSLAFNKTTGPAFLGGLTIGDGTGAASSAKVEILAANQAPTGAQGGTAQIQIGTDGELDLGANDLPLLNLTMNGGSVSATTGQLIFAGYTTPPSVITFSGTGSSSANIGAMLQINQSPDTNTRQAVTLSVAPTSAPVQLSLTGGLSGEGTLSKSLGGVASLSGDNSGFTGSLSVTGGTMEINSLANATVDAVNGLIGVEGLNQIASISINTLNLSGGGFLYDLGSGTSSDTIQVSQNITTTSGKTTAFVFNDNGFTTDPASPATTTFTLMQGANVNSTNLPLDSLSFVSLNIPGLTGTFQFAADTLEFVASHGTSAVWGATPASGAWQSGPNWVAGSIPATGANIQFNTSTQTAISTGTNVTTGAITFNAGASAFTISDNAIALGGDITNLSTNNQTINSNIVLNYSRSIIATDGDLQLGTNGQGNGNVAVSNGQFSNTLTFDAASGKTIQVFGNIANLPIPFATGQLKGNVTKTGDGTLVLSGTNTFSGTFTVLGGTVSVGSVNSIGSTNPNEAVSLVFDGGTLLATGALSFSSVAQVSLFNPITLGPGGLTLDASQSTNAVTLNVPLNGTGGLTKKGDNTLTLGSNTALSNYTGPLNIEGGTVLAAVAGAFGQTSGVSITGDGSLQLSTNMSISAPLSLGSTGNAESPGAIYITAGGVSSSGAITLSADTSIQVGSTQTATLDTFGGINLGSHTLTINTNGTVGVNLVNIHGNISGTGGFTKAGAATLSLLTTSINTFSGPIAVNGGILSVTVNENFKGSTGSITVANGASLQFNFTQLAPNQAPILISNDLTLSGAGVPNEAAGALYNLIGPTTLTGNVTLDAATTLKAVNGSLNFTGPTSTFDLQSNSLTLNFLPGTEGRILGAIGGTGSITLLGGGQFTLGGDNTFSGGMQLTGGFLRATNAAALGSGDIVVAANSSLGLSSTSGTNTFGDATQTVTLTGQGINNNGALRSQAGINTLVSIVAPSAGTTIQVDTGRLTLSNTMSLPAGSFTFNAVAATARMNLSGSISGGTSQAPVSITINSQLNPTAGTVHFAADNSNLYGTVNLTGGTLETGNTNAIVNSNLVMSSNTTVSPGGSGAVMVTNLQGMSFANGATNVNFVFGLTSPASSDQIAVAVGGVNFNNIDINFHLQEVGVFAGAGTYTLVSAQGAPVNFGSIHLVPSTALSSYQFSLEASGNDLNLIVVGTGPTAAIWDGGGSDGDWTTAANWQGDAVPASGSAISFDGALQTTVSTVNPQTTGAVTFAAGASAFIINDNTLTLAGDLTNNSANTQTINSGLIFTNSRSIDAASGEFTLGAIAINATSPASSTLTFTGANNIQVNGVISDTPTAHGNLAMTGSGILTLAGANTFTGTVTLTSGILAAASSSALGNGSATNNLIFDGGTLRAMGTLSSPAARAISLESTGQIDLNSHTVTLAGVIGGSGGLTTSGTGTLTLGGVNTYSGATTIGAGGVLSLTNNAALGSSSLVTIDSGAALQLQGGQTIGARPLALSGTGISGNGALRNISGTNTYGGAISLGAATAIQSDAGALTLSGAITNAGFDLSLAPQTGATITSSGGITGTGGVTMSGPGAANLTGVNSYTGDTKISTGTLASGSLTGSTVVVDGGAFSPGGLGSIASITVHGLTLDGGDLVFDLGTGTSDLITISGGTALLSSPTVFQFNSLSYTPGTFTLISGAGVGAFNLANLSFQSIVPGIEGEFQIVGSDLQFVSGSGSGSTWNGGAANDQWSSAANWDPTGVPATGAALTFAGTNELSVDTVADRSTGAITFAANAGAFVIENNTLTISGNITNSSTNTQTINSDIILGGNVTKTAATGDLALGGNIALSNSNAVRTLTFSGAGNTLVSGIVSNGTATSGNLAMTGTGTLTLTGVNTFTGTTTLSSGIVAANSSAALGSGGTTNTLIFDGGTLQATANIDSPATRGIQLQSGGTINTGAFDVTLDGVVSGPGGLAKTGTGNLILTGDNTYQGATGIHAGVLQLQSNNALGASSTGTAVAGGAALELTGGITISNEPLALNGAGINANGALRSVSGVNIYSGPILLGTAAEIQVDADSLTLNGPITLGSNLLTTDTVGSMTISGAIGGTGGLTKIGSDALILTGANTFTGTTTVSDGTLSLGSGGTSGSLVGGLVNNAAVNFNRSDSSTYGGVISGNGTMEKLGAGTLSLTGNSTTFSGTTTITTGTLQLGNGGTSGSLSGNIVNNSTLAFNRSDSLTYAGDLSGTGGLDMVGAGTFVLTGTNTYSGATNVAAGTLATGDLNNSHVTVDGGNFSPGGLNQIQTIQVASLTLAGGDLLFDLGTGTADRINVVGGTAGLTANTIFSFNNDTFTPGAFTLISGTGVAGFNLSFLSIHSNIPGLAGEFSIAGDDLIFTASLTTGSTWDGGAGTGLWGDANNWDPDGVPTASSPIIFAGSVQTTVDTQTNRTTGAMTFDANADAFVINNNTITLGGDIINHSGNVQTINSDVALTGSVTKTSASGDLVFGGDIALSTTSAIRTLTFDGTESTTVHGVISNGPTATSGNLVKNGTGTLNLLGVNTYSGTTTVNGGILAANSSAALGSGTSTNTLILNNATLQALGDIDSPSARGITLAGPAAIDTSTHQVTLGGVVGGTGGLTKTGVGTLVLAGSNTYTGATLIQAGTVNLQSNAALGAGIATATVANGATLELQNGITIASKPLTLNGSGLLNNGALRNLSGNNTYGGPITLASASEIQVDADSLTLTTGVSLGSQTLTADLTGNLLVSGTLFGTGGVTQTGPGTLTLTGANSYTGLTTVSSGTLQIGNGGTSGSLTGAILNNSNVIFNRSDSTTFGGVISGSGSVTKSGDNTLTLTGANTYLGITNINGGILQIGNGGTTGSLTGPVVNNATLTFNRSNNSTYAGAVSGSGTLIKSGAGTLTLTGANTYSGQTFILGGTLAPGNLASSKVTLNAGFLSPGGLGNVVTISVAGLVLDGGSFLFDLGNGTSDRITIGAEGILGNQATSFTFNNASFVPGTFTLLSGTGVDSLDPTSFDYISNIPGMTGTFSVAGTNLLFTATHSGIVTGPLLENSAPVNTPDFATFWVQGQAQTGKPNENNTIGNLLFAPGSQLTVFNNLAVTGGNFNVQGGLATLIGGRVLAPNGFDKSGAGDLDLRSDLSVNGPALVSQGGLYVNAQMDTPGGLTVLQNALLGGSGVINGNVFNNGTVNPGNSPGTLTINGNFTQSSSGTLQIEAASLSNFDRLIVTGTASLAGTLQFIPLGGFQPAYGQQFAFLEAGSIVGNFDSIQVPATFRGRFINQGNIGILLLAPDTYTRVATNQNQFNVARALDSFIPQVGNDKEVVSTALDFLTAEQYPAAFDQIMPAFHESVANIGINLAQTQGQLMQQQLSAVRLGGRGFRASGVPMEPLTHDKGGQKVEDAKSFKGEVSMETPVNPRWSAWAQGNGIFAKATSAMSLPNYRFESGGFLVGADYEWSETFVTGAFVGYQGAYARYGNGADTRMNGVRFGAYATYDPVDSGFYADGAVWGGVSDYQTRRKIQFSTIDRTASASQDTGELSALLGGGYDWQVGNFTFGPAASLQYTYFGVAPFTETGADSLNLRVGQQNSNSLQSYIGGRVAYTAKLSESILLIPEVRMFWQHEFLNNPRTINAGLDGGNSPWFAYRTEDPSRDAVWAGVGATIQVGQRFNASLFYNADFGRQDYISHVISANLGFSF